MRCPGSQIFPTNYDGETTHCDQCGRKLRLGVNGKLPNHNTAPKQRKAKLLPRGEAIVDGRRCGS